MNFPIFKRVFPKAMAWAGLAALCGVMALAQTTPVAPPPAPVDSSNGVRTDSQIEMEVVHALDDAQKLKGDLITAATIQGEVTLSGTVSSNSNRKLANSIAKHVQGVTKVYDNLKVGNPQEPQATQAEVYPGNQQPPENQPGGTGAPYAEAGQTYDQEQLRGQIHDEVQNQIQEQRQAQPQAPAYEIPTGPVTIHPGTLLQLRTSEPVNSKRARDGEPVQFMVIRDVAVGNFLAIPRGAIVHGVVSEAHRAGVVAGSPELALQLVSLEMGGQSYPLDSDQFKVKGPNKAGRTVGRAFGGALLGALIGGAVDGGFGAAVGAGTGAAAGTASSAASSGPGIWIPSEARVDFHLLAPLTVTPVSAQEAARLAQGLYQGGPELHQRGYPPPYGRPYPYVYPPVYYRPYYAVGGYYSWR
jgi:hypothetical protein